MTNWYYHAPGAGRAGPFSADAMREHYRQRRIVLDTLVWHAGLREWQPLERQLDALQLVGVRPDKALPPPLPPRAPPAVDTSRAAPASYSAARPATSSSSRRTGCLIVAAIAVAGLMLIGLLAAIALPSYRDYVERARRAQPPASGSEQSTPTPAPPAPARSFDADHMASADALTRELVETAMREFYRANGNTCPDSWEFERIQVREPRLQGSEDGWSGLTPAHPHSGQCAYDIQYYGFGPAVDQRTLRYEVSIDGDTVSIVCRNKDLRREHLPPGCEG
jgi:hypothetical protein